MREKESVAAGEGRRDGVVGADVLRLCAEGVYVASERWTLLASLWKNDMCVSWIGDFTCGITGELVNATMSGTGGEGAEEVRACPRFLAEAEAKAVDAAADAPEAPDASSSRPDSVSCS
jgi:hypothetical protein